MFRFAPLVLLIAAPVFADDTPTDQEAELIELVAKLGGRAELDPDLDDEFRVAAVFDTVDDAVLMTLCKRPLLGSLDLRSAAKVTADGFSALRELPNLQHLYIGASTISAPEAAAIGTLRPLTVLALSGCKLTDAELARFVKLKHLKALDLLDTPVTDRAVDAILELSVLEELNLAGTRISDAGAKKLLTLEGLRLLQLNNTRVSAAAITAMEEELQASERELKILR